MSAVEILQQSQDWSNLRTRIDALSTAKQKGDCFELLVKHHLQLDPKYATKLKHVWLLKETPPLLRKRLRLPGPDEGIDLIAETNEGRYWAIQAKYRSDHFGSLTRRELATFTDLAFGVCAEIDLALVCTTADRLSAKLRYHGTRLAFCSGETWRSLDTTFFEALHARLRGAQLVPRPMVPRPHQSRAISRAREHYEKATRGKLIMPCGTGKSLTAFWIAKELSATRVLVAVPSLALVRQTLSVWARECLANSIEVRWIAVCSDKTVGDADEIDGSIFTQDLGVDVETDVGRIASWLCKPGDARTTVVFATYQSGEAIAKAARMAGFVFDLAIFDEAHRTVGKRQALFGHLLFDENLAATKRLFMTATERRYSGTSNSIVGMESPTVYGGTFELLSFKAALEAQPPILSDYRILTMVVTKEEVERLIERNRLVALSTAEPAREYEAHMVAALIALRKAITQYRIQHAISFHRSIARARTFRDAQEAFGRVFPEQPLRAFHLNGDTHTAIRDQILTEFEESSCALVTNARCLSEGVDIPSIDCVLFADPKRSAVDIVQAVGRALRPTKSGGPAYVLVPVQVDELSDEAEISESVFASVLTILRALAANDERIIEFFRSVASGKPLSGRSIPFELTVPDSIRLETENFVRSVELKCWSRLGKLAWRPFEEARDFVRGLGLRTTDDWLDYCSGRSSSHGTRPPDIPSAPYLVYRGQGWKNFADWVGYERQYRSFAEARGFAQSLRLRGQVQWFDYVTGRLQHSVPKPPDVPSNPSAIYATSGWKGYGDFLGTGRLRNPDWQPFDRARQFARSLGLRTPQDWQAYVRGEKAHLPKKPPDIPANPSHRYSGRGWNGWADWLREGHVKRLKVAMPFEDARNIVRQLNLRSIAEWRDYAAGKRSDLGSRAPGIPKNPRMAYRGVGWTTWEDWLGCPLPMRGKPGRRAREWRAFAEAREFARSLGLKSMLQWSAYCRGETVGDLPPRPIDIPVSPARAYAGAGWIDGYDWLGIKTEWAPFEAARNFVRSLGLRSRAQYIKYRRGEMAQLPACPSDVPGNPYEAYRTQWKGWTDWFGAPSRWRSFEEARKFARSLKLRSASDWKRYCRGKVVRDATRPQDIPPAPHRTYADKGWINWDDWLLTDSD